MKCITCETDCDVFDLSDNGLCRKCTGKRSNYRRDSNLNENSESFFVNELLCYVFWHFNNSTFDGLKKVLVNFFHPDEVSQAKKLLWEKCSNLLNPIENRRGSAARSQQIAEIIDILNAVKKIDQTQSECPAFVSKNLDRIPKFGPSEFDLSSIVERLGDVERQLKTLQSSSLKHEDDIMTLFSNKCDGMKSGDAVVSGIQDAGTSHEHPSFSNPSTESNEPLIRKHLYSDAIINGKSAPNAYVFSSKNCPDYMGAHSLVVNLPPEDEEVLSDMKKDKVECEGSDFQISREDKKRQARARRREAAVYGKSTQGGLKGAKRTVDIFVFRVDKATIDSEVKNYMESQNIIPVKTKCVSSDESVYKSYCITVNYNDKDTVFNDEF